MKTLDQMLQSWLAPEVTEFAVVSDRLPCVKVDGKYHPIDDRLARSEAILEMLVASGGSRYVDELQGAARRVDHADGGPGLGGHPGGVREGACRRASS